MQDFGSVRCFCDNPLRIWRFRVGPGKDDPALVLQNPAVLSWFEWSSLLRYYLKGQGDLVSRLVTTITYIIPPVILSTRKLTESP